MGDELAPRATAPGLEPATAGQSAGESAVRSAEPAPSAHGLPPGAVILEQDFDFGSLYALRSAVSAHAADVGMGTSRLYDVVTTAHELAANAVRHGAGRGHLRLWVLDGILHCEVSDAGRPAPGDTAPGDIASSDIASGDTASGDTASGDTASGGSASGGSACGAPAPEANGADADGGGSAAWRSEHGHGLWVVGQIADQFTIDRGNGTGTIATAAFSLGVTRPPSA
jgi:Histidine kinase-like ATPase domain